MKRLQRFQVLFLFFTVKLPVIKGNPGEQTALIPLDVCPQNEISMVPGEQTCGNGQNVCPYAHAGAMEPWNPATSNTG